MRMSPITQPTESFRGINSATDLGISLGTIGYDDIGNKYRWVKTKTAIPAQGYCLIQQVAAVTAIANITAYSGGNAPYFTDNTAITVTAGELARAFAFVYGGTGAGQLGRIKKHGALSAAAPSAVSTGLYLESPFTTGLSTDSDIAILQPFVADLSTAGSGALDEIFVGVSTGAVTDEYYTWLIEEGYGVCHVQGSAPSVGDMLTLGGATDAGKFLAESATYDVSGNPVAKVVIVNTGAADAVHFCKIGGLL